MGFGMGQQMGRNMMGGGRRRGGFHGGGFGHGGRRGRRAFGGMGYGGGMGCGTTIIMLVFIFIIVAVLNEGMSNVGRQRIPPSTVVRTALTSSAIADGDVLTYQDATRQENWFNNTRAMQNGANAANRLTGVKFGIYVANEINGNSRPGNTALNEFADNLYEQWFGNSGGHVLIVLIDDGQGNFVAMDIVGSSARTVFDDEAMDILFGFIDRYWNEPDRYDESQMFGLAFEYTAERIMTVTPTTAQVVARWIFIPIIIIVIFIGIVMALKANEKRRLAAAEQTRADAELLATPIAGLDGAPQRDPLLEKYNDPQD
jgi:uncharacterized membrane protein